MDFLKRDIEGGERLVVPSIEKTLGRVRNIFCEYHGSVGQKQALEDILLILSCAGFRYFIKGFYCSDNPFLDIKSSYGFDVQLNIFGVRLVGTI